MNEEIKQAILNGAYAVSRNGMKCKFIGHALNIDDYTHTFMYLNGDGLIYSTLTLNDNFKSYEKMESDFDVIGLWQNKAEPFNLEKALAGEPVMLRNGSKAYVKFVMPSEYNGKYPLNGYITNPYSSDVLDPEQWTMEGREYNDGKPYDYDIISMWTDLPTELRQITVNLPSALKDPKDEMWFIAKNGIFQSSYNKHIPEHVFLSKPYFGSEQDAKAWWEAMMNSRGI